MEKIHNSQFSILRSRGSHHMVFELIHSRIRQFKIENSKFTAHNPLMAVRHRARRARVPQNSKLKTLNPLTP
jgi:hypothetical protein